MKSATNEVKLFKWQQNNGIVIKWSVLVLRCFPCSSVGKESESKSCLVMSHALRPHRLYSPWHSPGQKTRMGSLFLLQGIFPVQGSNPGLPHCRWILYQLSYQRIQNQCWLLLSFTDWGREWQPLQYSCWKIPWIEDPGGPATVHGVTKSRTLSD